MKACGLHGFRPTTLAVAVLLPPLIAAALSGTALARQEDHACAGPVGYVPGDILERPTALKEGVGRAHEVVTTSSSEAQAFYDQGVAYLHSYVWIEAARSFHQALRSDPSLAMVYVGLSRAYSGLEDPGAARAALVKAQDMAAGSTGPERRRIAIRAKQLDAMEDFGNAAKLLEYRKAIDEGIVADRSDVELWLIRGNAEEPTAAGRGQRGGLASTLYYEKVLALDPDNFAAHHYLVHSFETIDRIDEALKHGEAYARLAPAIPHAHHMYGHDLRRVGRIEEAIDRFRKADDLEQAYYRTEKIPDELDWHHKHNLDLLSTSYQYVGRLKTAEELMKEAGASASVTDYLEFNRKEWPEFLLSRGRNDEALDAARKLVSGKWAVTRAAGHALAGQALLAMGKTGDASRELVESSKALEEAPLTSTGVGVPRSGAEPYVESLRAEILLRQGKKEEARPIFLAVEKRLRGLPGPDAWSQTLFRLESIARIAREADDWDLADLTAKQMVEHDPSYAGTHFATALVAEHRADQALARKELQEAERLWRGADPDLPELNQIRSRIAALR